MVLVDDPCANKYIVNLIRVKAAQIGRRYGVTRIDREQIEHDLISHVQCRLSRYDPTRAKMTTFVSRVVDRWIASHLRHQFAEKRDPRRVACSLDDLSQGGHDDRLGAHRVPAAPVSPEDATIDLRLDLDEVRGALPSDAHRQCMDALMRHGSINACATQLGLSRRSIARYSDDIRRACEDRGLRLYL